MNRDHQTKEVPDLMKALQESLKPVGDSTPPATPVVEHDVPARSLSRSAVDVITNPPAFPKLDPPAVSGEGERLRAMASVVLDALACWQGEDETYGDEELRRVRGRSARAELSRRMHEILRASTPTPGAPR